MNTSIKTLLQLLVEELPKHGGWPEKAKTATQSVIDGEIYFRDRFDQLINRGIKLEKVVKLQSSRITREQYEAALAEKEHPLPWDQKNTDTDGWIDWAGGECPVDHMQAVEVRYRDGTIKPVAPAFHYLWTNGYGDCKTTDADVVAYRLHQPQDAEKTVDNFEGAPEWAMLRVKHKIDGDEYFISSMDEMKYQSIGAMIGLPLKFSHKHWDVIATREPQDANSRANDERLDAAVGLYDATNKGEIEETKLNDCIGQTPEDLEQLTRLVVEDIQYSAPEITVGSAYKIAASLIDAGYRKQ